MACANPVRNTQRVKYSGSVLSCLIAVLVVMNAFTLLFGQTQGTPVAGGDMASALDVKTPTSPGPDVVTAKALLGRTVEGATGETVGKINDVLINTQSGRVTFVVLASGGFLGVGTKLRPVPPGALSRATAKAGVLALDIGPQRWKLAPRMNKERLENLERPAVAQKIYAYYQQPWRLSSGGDSAAQAEGTAAHLKPASELIGESVITRRNGEIGHISDLSLTLKNEAMAHAIISPSDSDRKPFIIPINLLSSNAEGASLILNADLEQSQSAHTSGSIRLAEHLPFELQPITFVFNHNKSQHLMLP